MLTDGVTIRKWPVYKEKIWRHKNQSMMEGKYLKRKSIDKEKQKFWCSMSWAGVGEITSVEGKWSSKTYTFILTSSLEKSRKKLKLPKKFILLLNNDPCNKSKYTHNNLKSNKISVITFPPWSPDLNVEIYALLYLTFRL